MKTLPRALLIAAAIFIAAAGALSTHIYAWPGTKLFGGVQISSGGGGGGGNVACDQGPNTNLPTGTLGTDLATAGFTHCALNADFTTTSTDANGINYSNKATFISECGATTAWRFYLIWDNGNDPNADTSDAPCNRVNIVTDLSLPALFYQFAPADHVGAIWDLTLWWPGCGSLCSVGSNQSMWMPFEAYIEVTYRYAANSAVQTNSPLIHQFDWTITDGDPCCPTSSWEEYIMFEVYSPGTVSPNANNGTINDWVNGSITGVAGHGKNMDFSNYQTQQWLLTSNGTSTVALCTLTNSVYDVPLSISGFHTNCSTEAPIGGGTKFTQHNHRFNWAAGDFTRGLTGTLINPVGMFIRSIRIFTCAGYKTGMCHGTVISPTIPWAGG